ncbi:(2Fe-2S)-binding protein [Streptomyces sp. Ru71]|uniref:2Fe-2S iron-sulfur cluster-binding protein n=1 Tax=Streptomyces sp. Ru71 TaxID=2080746 RepID=UPI000CDE0F2A|nr:2Fe-2S iron-sulfur cluster-binding protein [Streptomyces sp. Ru71]POX49424.1 (2Fe-2S)-binding protein [Streptomyces sp. Ru71]
MTDDQHGPGTPQGGGRWDPLPQGDYDDGATAFVELPEGGIDALLAGDSPLAAPGHGYVPPQITVAPATTAGTDPAATGTWSMPVDGAQWGTPAQGEASQPGADDRFTYQPGATGQWNFEEHTGAYGAGAAEQEPAPAPGHDVTGQWSIPVAGGDLPDESGEYTTSALVEQWGGTPPATLPGGAPAPWATGAPGQPWDTPQPAAETPGEQPQAQPAHGGDAATGHAHDAGYPQAPDTGHFAGHGGEYAAPADVPVTDTAAAAPAETAGAPEASAAPEAPADSEAPGDESASAAEAPDDEELPAEGAPTAVPEQEPYAEEAAPQEPAVSPERRETPEQQEQAESPADPSGEPAAPQDAPAPHAPEASAPHDERPLASYTLRVNGTDRPVGDAWIGESLLYVLRERLGLAGAKDGCSQGECGACNVQVDGRLVASCLVPAVTAAGSEVRTVEGLAQDGQPSDVQRALARCGAVQCGFCVPGMAMTVHDLLEGNPAPTELEARQALCGNLCRCSGYRGVLRAVQEVVAEREALRAGDGETDGDEPRIPHQAGPGAGGVHPSAFEAGGHPAAFGDPGGPHGHDQQPYGQGEDGGQA